MKWVSGRQTNDTGRHKKGIKGNRRELNVVHIQLWRQLLIQALQGIFAHMPCPQECLLPLLATRNVGFCSKLPKESLLLLLSPRNVGYRSRLPLKCMSYIPKGTYDISPLVTRIVFFCSLSSGFSNHCNWHIHYTNLCF